MTFWVLGKYGLNFSALLGGAVERSSKGEALLAPGLQYTNKIDFISLGVALVLGTAFAHDVYAGVLKKGQSTPGAEVRVARRTALLIGIVAIAGGILANGQNVAFLVALAFAVAASANLPTILYSLFWKRFNTMRALWSIYGGLAVCLVLTVFSPAVSGSGPR
jgi:Na+(H+)/acetate symporter ActP